MLVCSCSLISLSAIDTAYAETENSGIDVGKEKLSVKDSRLVDSDGNQFVIHGIAIGDSDDANMYYTKCSQTTYKLLKEEGFNTVRYTFGVSLFIDLETHKLREENMEVFDQIVENATAAGMYIIIDLHILRTKEYSFYSKTDDYCLIGEDKDETAAAKAENYKTAIYTLWEAIVSRMKGSDCILAYSLINEPYGGIDLSKITYTSWDDYLAAGHTGSDWNTYYEEKTTAIVALRNEAKTAIRSEYSDFIQTLIDEIRAIDKETTICFQELCALCDVSANYKYTSFPECGWTKEDRLPDITADNILFDSNHIYDNAQFDYTVKDADSAYYGEKVGVINMTSASGASYVQSWYSGVAQPAKTSDAICSATFDIAEDNDAILLGWSAAYITNNGTASLTATVNSLKVYKEINGESVEIFSATEEETNTAEGIKKLRAYGQLSYKYGQDDYNAASDSSFIGSSITIASGAKSNTSGNGVQSLEIGVKPGENVTIAIGLTLSSESEISAEMSFCGNLFTVGKNDDGQDLICGDDAVKKLFSDAKTASDKYGSPVYFAEFCVMSNYINDYTNYMDYTNCFVKYLEEYNAGWVWHCMSEKTGVTNDNGYGAYLNTVVPYAEYKNVGFTSGVIPKLLTTTAVILNENAPASSTNGDETVDSSNGTASTDGGTATESYNPAKNYNWLYALCGVVVGAVVGCAVCMLISVRKKK